MTRPATNIDVLMVTYNRPTYTRLSLEHLLDSCDESMRVWVWHNGNDQDTLDVVASMRGHARFHEFHHSPENQRTWLWHRSWSRRAGFREVRFAAACRRRRPR